MIKNITLKFGSSPGSNPINIPTAPVTIFVGPNNSGKSLILNEMHNFCSKGLRGNPFKILDKIEFIAK